MLSVLPWLLPLALALVAVALLVRRILRRGAGWRLDIVCVSPVASERAVLTLAVIQSALAEHPSAAHVLQCTTVAYDDRDADREMYAPPLTRDAHGVDASATRDILWSSRRYDNVVAMAALSKVQTAELLRVVARSAYAINGLPGFNVLVNTQTMAQLRAGGGLVEDASSACVFSLAEHATYMASLPELARAVAMRSRVAFPFTARGDTADGCGSYGRQFRNGSDRPTRRAIEWYAALADEYAAVLEATCDGEKRDAARRRRMAAEVMQRLALALHSEAEVWRRKADRAGKAPTVRKRRGTPERDATASGVAELNAILSVCSAHVNDGVVEVLREHAPSLHPLLVAADARVGVESTKVYDAKLVISTIARQAASEGVLPLSAWGLGADGSSIVDNDLMREIIMALLTLHLPTAGSSAGSGGKATRYESTTHAEAVRHVLRTLHTTRLPFQHELYLVDTGADPNEDDVAAILVRVNASLLMEGRVLETLTPTTTTAGATRRRTTRRPHTSPASRRYKL